MEELFKSLNIDKIEYLKIEYIDKDGIRRIVTVDRSIINENYN